jgi:hypothetical protein
MNLEKFIAYNRVISAILFKWLDKIFCRDQLLYDKFLHFIQSKAEKSNLVCELGTSDRPLLSKKNHSRYVGVDIDRSKAPQKEFDSFYFQSVEEKLDLYNVDLIFSQYLFEHVYDVRISYINLYQTLSYDGIIANYYPLGWHPFSIINKILGNTMGKKLIAIFRPNTKNITGYPAYYNLGSYYELEKFFKAQNWKYKCYYSYSAEDYFSFFFPFGLVIYFFNVISEKFNLKIFASNVFCIIYK